MKFLPKEVWRDVPGYEKLYMLSTNGDIVVLNYRGTGKTHLLKASVGDTHTHKNVWLYKNGEGKSYLVHVLVAKTFPDICGEWFGGCVVHHKNHNPIDNRPQNLIVLTNGEHTRLHNTGEKLSEETKHRISEAKKGKPAHNKGVPMSEEQKAKLLGCNNPSHKAVIQYTKDGECVREWDYAKLASDELGINPSSISLCCKGKTKTAGGYIWKYKSEV